MEGVIEEVGYMVIFYTYIVGANYIILENKFVFSCCSGEL